MSGARFQPLFGASHAKEQPMAKINLLPRWGRLVARSRWVVLPLWALLVIACVLVYPRLSQNLRGPDYSVTGSESEQVEHEIAEHFHRFGAEQDVIVFHSAKHSIDTYPFRSLVDQTIAQTRHSAGVVSVLGPFDPLAREQITPDRHSAIAFIGLRGDARTRSENAAQLQHEISNVHTDDITVSTTGFSPIANDIGDVEAHDAELAESVGIPIALLILVLAFGAVVPAMFPLIATAVGLLLSYGVLATLSEIVDFDSIVVTISTMIGTGIGIDYALFIVSRYREELANREVNNRTERPAINDAVAAALGTAGRTVTFSGLIVVISLCSLLVVDAPVFREISLGVAVTVFAVLTVALTLLPAMLAVMGPAVNRGMLPSWWRRADTRSVGEAPINNGWWASWAQRVMRRPVWHAVGATLVLVVLAMPLPSIHYGIDLGTRSLAGTNSGRANAVLESEFSTGLMAPIEIVLQGPGGTALTAAQETAANRYISGLVRNPHLTRVVAEHNDGRMLVVANSDLAIDTSAVTALVQDLRSHQPTGADAPQILVGGIQAQFVDLSDLTNARVPIVVAAVLILSMLFLSVFLGSIVLPLKAIAMNLLVTAASIGATVAVFQWGVGASILHFDGVGYLQVYLPITVFAVLFGLSMDYEVFLLGRMKEAWDNVGDSAAAVAEGLAHTARPITSAAAIMIAVFASFLTADVLELKEFGLALATAVLLDAVVVRLILVPSLMRLLGAANWWPGSWRAVLNAKIRQRDSAQKTLAQAGRPQ
jgi:putative drug exporter of the RND superfamily